MHRILVRVLEWSWVRREVARALGKWLAKRIRGLAEPWQDMVVTGLSLPPGRAVAELADRYGEEWLREPAARTVLVLLDRVDGSADYLAEGWRTFLRELGVEVNP
jgi:hypothetical protein